MVIFNVHASELKYRTFPRHFRLASTGRFNLRCPRSLKTPFGVLNKPLKNLLKPLSAVLKPLSVVHGGGGRCHNLKNGKEISEVTEGKSSRMRWGR